MTYKISSLLKMVALASIVLSGCTKPPVIKYNPQDFVNPNRLVTAKNNLRLPSSKINATFGYGNNPAVIKAYQRFTKHGHAQNIQSGAFRTIAYDSYAHPIIACAPLHLCVVQLERGEMINDIELGDTKHWILGKSLVGSAHDGSFQIILKPKLIGLATDMVISTHKRVYDIGLVSVKDAATHIVNFYYPEETLAHTVEQLRQSDLSGIGTAVSQSSVIDLNHLNFNYQLSGDNPAWKPLHVFDDGTKTYIDMPPISERMNLPILYLLRNKEMQLVNYRYRRPYYVVDSLFRAAYLISGKGKHQVRVVIHNRNFG